MTATEAVEAAVTDQGDASLEHANCKGNCSKRCKLLVRIAANSIRMAELAIEAQQAPAWTPRGPTVPHTPERRLYLVKQCKVTPQVAPLEGMTPLGVSPGWVDAPHYPQRPLSNMMHTAMVGKKVRESAAWKAAHSPKMCACGAEGTTSYSAPDTRTKAERFWAPASDSYMSTWGNHSCMAPVLLCPACYGIALMALGVKVPKVMPGTPKRIPLTAGKRARPMARHRAA